MSKYWKTGERIRIVSLWLRKFLSICLYVATLEQRKKTLVNTFDLTTAIAHDLSLGFGKVHSQDDKVSTRQNHKEPKYPSPAQAESDASSHDWSEARCYSGPRYDNQYSSL